MLISESIFPAPRSVTRRTVRRTLLSVAVLSLAAGCGRDKTTTAESTGEVAETWAPEALSEVRKIPVGEIRSAIETRLESEQIVARFSKDTRAHAKRLYAAYSGGPLWLKSKGLDRERVGFLLRALADGEGHGFDIAAYPLAEIAEAVNAAERSGAVTAEDLSRADVILTAAYALLGEDLLTGQIDPGTVSQSWHINPREEKIDSALARTLRSEPLDRAISTMAPQDDGYAALKTELVRYRDIVARGGWPAVSSAKLLKRGDAASAELLAALRARLAVEGIVVDTAAAEPGTGRYDQAHAAGVAEFQARHGIPVDSMLGPETVASMNIPADFRLGQIASNMERYRWLPRTLGSKYVLVNVPAFYLQAFDEGQPVLEMKVIVGAEFDGRATPVFSDSMQYVVFRPYWNVTDNIAENEIWPKIRADPGYAAANNYEIVTERGKTRIRQRPGEQNALGLVKFMFPNEFDIYLHDTPNRSLFDQDVRGFSHGCIRVEKPDELAQWVLGWPADRVREAMKSGAQNREVRLPETIPVFITYFTAFERDGKLHFANDFYSRDDRMVEAVSAGGMPDEAARRTAAQLRQIADDWTKGRRWIFGG